MPKILPPISRTYKTEVRNAVILTGAFFLIYGLLLLLSAATMVMLGWLACQIIVQLGFSLWSVILSMGIVGFGAFIFIFLIKFIFSTLKEEKSTSIQINRSSEPELYRLIDEVVADAGTQKPKRVFLCADVNAYVSYHSIFWSTILPVRKNLTIGLGLINTTTSDELKAVLAHEFGHFSQRSMVVGSYVNQANKIIYNTLHDNAKFSQSLNTFAQLNIVASFFAELSILIISGIQWILKKNL